MIEGAIEVGSELGDVEAEQITGLIPHRYPFLLIDRVIEIRAFESATGIKSVSMNEPFFQGHFPGDPIMPGVLVIEAMAQTAAVMVVRSRDRAGYGDGVYFMAIEDARFRQPVRPGRELRLEIAKLKQKLGIWRFTGRALVEGKVAAEARFMAKVMDATDSPAK